MRIRTVKPEFYRSADIAVLPRDLRLLFVGLWSYVDDNGVGVDDYRQITADLFPLDEDMAEAREFVREGLATLSRGGLIERYEPAGKPYLFVTTWDLHQKVDKPNKPRYPRPEPVTCDDPGPGVVSRDPRDTLAPVTGEQGNRGTEEQEALVTSGGGSGGEASRKRSAEPKGHRLPDDWWPTEEDRAWFRDKCPDLEGRGTALTEEFRDYWHSRAGKEARKLDWSKTWRNRMREKQDRAHNQKSPRDVPLARPSASHSAGVTAQSLLRPPRTTPSPDSQPQLRLASGGL